MKTQDHVMCGTDRVEASGSAGTWEEDGEDTGLEFPHCLPHKVSE